MRTKNNSKSRSRTKQNTITKTTLKSKKSHLKKSSISKITSKQVKKQQTPRLSKKNKDVETQITEQQEKPVYVSEVVNKKIEEQSKQNERYYCTNPNLLREMYYWRNSLKNGIRIKKLVGKRKMVDTEIVPNTPQLHEAYQPGTRYFIEYPKSHRRYTEKLYLDKVDKSEKDSYKFYREYEDKVVEDVTQYVIDDGYTFDIDIPQDREFTTAFAEMILVLVKKISNHSYFRRYSQETKEDCQLYAIEKIFKGLFNYKLKYTNVFAYLTQAVFNSFKSELTKYYKQINIKRSLTKKAMVDLHSNMSGSSMEKCLGNQFRNNDYDDFSEF